MVKVLLIDPALSTLRDRFAERLPGDVEVAVVADFGDDEFRRQAADATVLVNARRSAGDPGHPGSLARGVDFGRRSRNRPCVHCDIVRDVTLVADG